MPYTNKEKEAIVYEQTLPMKRIEIEKKEKLNLKIDAFSSMYIRYTIRLHTQCG